MNRKILHYFATAERQRSLHDELESWRGTRFFRRAAPAVKGVRADCVSFVEAVLVNLGAIKPITWPSYVTHFGGDEMRKLMIDTLDQIPELGRVWSPADPPSTETSRAAANVSATRMVQPGDILACSSKANSHLGIYAGGNRIMHALETSAGIEEGNIHDPTILRRLIAIYRVL